MPKLDNKTKKAQVQEDSSSEEEEVTTKKVKGNVGTVKAAPAKGKAPAKKVESSDESEEEVIQPQKGKVAQKAVQKADQKNKKVQESDSDTSSDEDLKKPAAKKATVTTTAKPVTKAPAKKVVESEEDSDEEEPQQPKKKAAAKPAAKKAEIDDDVSDSDEAPKKAATKAPVKAAAKPAAKKVESSDEESEEEVKPKKAQPTKAAAKPAAKKVESSDEESEEEVKPKAKTATKAPVKAAAKPVAKKTEESSEESEDETPKAKTATKAPVKAAAKPAAKKVESEDEESEEEPVKTKTVAPVTAKPLINANAGGFNKAQEGGAKANHPNEIIVKGLPFAASENDIAEFFSGCEGYESVNLLKGPDGRSKGIAFARFSTEDGLNQALALNNSDMQGRYIVIEKTTPKEQRPANNGMSGGRFQQQDFSQKTQRDPNSSSIFIGNLSYNTTEQSLRSFFEQCGEIYGLRIAMDQDGRPRGFAHVDFAAPDAVDKAVALAGHELDGRAIRVDFSAGKKQGGQGGFGGQGGYGGGQGGFGARGGRPSGPPRMNLSEGDAAKKKGSISSFAGQKQRL